MTTAHIIQLHLEKLPEGLWLATSNDVQGLIAQGRTISEAIEIARDVARKLIELQSGEQGSMVGTPVAESLDYPVVLEL
jgi:predicted RNase H-like HicB family nuclease